MTMYRVSAVVFTVLVVLAGCKKKPPANTPEEAQGGPPSDVPARRVVEALDRMPAEVAQDKVPFYALGKLAESMPQPAAPGGIALDATDHRAAIDASVAKLWAAWETFPERMRQKVIRDQTAALLKQGMTLDSTRRGPRPRSGASRSRRSRSPPRSPTSTASTSADSKRTLRTARRMCGTRTGA